MNLNIDFSQAKEKLATAVRFLHSHGVVSLTLIGAILGLIIIQSIQSALYAERSEQVYMDELTTFDNVQFDAEVIAEIVTLTANEVNIQPDLPENRDNPFLDF